MPHDLAKSPPQVRIALSGATLLLVLGLVAATTLDGVRPGLRHLARQSGVQTVQVRHLSESFARAVRELVGSDTHKPVARLSLPGLRDSTTVRILIAPDQDNIRSPQRLLRSALLDLPPPTA